MAVSIGEIEATLKLRDQLTPALKLAATELEKTGASVKKFGNELRTTGGALSMAFTAPLLAAAAASVKFSSDFETVMTRVETLSGVSADRVKDMRKEILELAPAVGVGPQELADALLVITSTGLRGSEAMEILNESAKAAAAGLGTTKDVARTLTSAMTAYGKENISAAEASNKLFVAVREGGADADQFAGALGRVIGISSQVGVSFDEVVASIATFTRLGVDADEAVTALRGTMTVLLRPTAQAKKELLELGSSIEQVRKNVKENGLASALIDLVKLTKGNDDAIASIVPNVRALAGVLGTAGAQAGAYADILKQVNNAETELDTAFGRTTKTVGFQWNQFIAGASKLGIELGDRLAPAFTSLLSSAKSLIESGAAVLEWFTKLPKPIQEAALASIALAAALGPVLFLFGNLLTAFGGVASLIAASVKGWYALTAAVSGTAAAAAATTAAQTAAATSAVAASAAISTEAAAVAAATETQLAFNFAAAEGAQLMLPLSGSIAATGVAATTASVGFGAMAASVSIIGGLLVGLGFALKQTMDGVENLANAFKNGNFWETITAKDDDTFLRRWLGWSKAANDSADALRNAGAAAAATRQQFESMKKELSGATDRGNIEDIARIATELSNAGLLVPAAMRKIAAAVKTFHDNGVELPPVLANIVAAVEQMRKTAQNIGTDKKDTGFANLVVSVKAAQAELDSLSATARGTLVSAMKAGQFSIEEISKRTGVTEAALHLLEAQVKKTAKAADDFKKAQQSIEEFLQPVETLGADVAEAIKYLLKLGASQQDLAAYFGVSKGAIKGVNDELETTAKAMELAAQQSEFFKKQFQETAVPVMKATSEALAQVAMTEQKYLNQRIHMNDTASQKIAQDWKMALADLGAPPPGMEDAWKRAAEAINQAFVAELSVARMKEEVERVGRENATGFMHGFSEILVGLPALLQQAFTGGGGFSGFAKGLGAQFGALFGDALAHSKIGTGLADSLASMLGVKSGAGAGLIANFVTGGIQAALGLAVAGIGKLIGLLKKPEWQKLAHDVGRDWGVQISDGLAKQMEADSKKFGRQAAELLNLDKIIGEAGGVKEFGVDKAMRGLHDLFAMFAAGRISAHQVGDEFDKVFGQLLPEATSKTTGLISQQMRDLIDLTHKFGVESQGVTDFYAKMGQQVATGFNAVVQGVIGPLVNSVDTMINSGDKLVALNENAAKIQASIDDMMAKGGPANEKQRVQLEIWKRQLADVQTQITFLTRAQKEAQKAFEEGGKSGQDAFDRMGRLATVAFAAAVAGGQSFLQALESIGPALDTLTRAQQLFGFTSSGAFDELLKFRQFADVNKELLGELDGLNKMMSALNNLGLLTQETFQDIETTAGEAFKKMVDGGLTSDQALRLMQPTLQTIWQLQQEFGFTVDENTQKLIDQAVEAGIVGEKHKDAAHQMVDAMKSVEAILTAIAKKLGADLPKAAADGAKGVNDALDSIKDRDVNVNVHTNDTPGSGDQPNTPGFASGSGGIRDFGAGTLAMLHGREGVYTADQIAALVGNSVAAGSGGSSDDGSNAVVEEIAQLRLDMSRMVATMQKTQARLTRDAVQKTARR